MLRILIVCAALLAQAPGYNPVRNYDPARNGAQDLQAAVDEARRTGRNVLVEVGGQWCSWCRVMDRWFQEHPATAALRDKHYVVVAINYSDENKNEPVLSRFPKIETFPHLFVLDASGRLLQSQRTAELEQGRGYNSTRMRRFLLKWSPRNSAIRMPASP